MKNESEVNPWFSGEYDNYDFESIKRILDFSIDSVSRVGKEIL